MVYPLAHMLGGAMLFCALVLLWQRRLSAMITLYRIQAITLTAAAFWQGYAQNADDLYFTGLITLAANVIIAPMALRRIVQRFNFTRAVETTVPVWLSMILGAALVGVAVLVMPPAAINSIPPAREDLAMSLSIVLLGLLVMAARRDALIQVIGFLSTGNGLMLTAIEMPGMPFVAALPMALLALAASLIAGVFMFRTSAHLDPLNFTSIEEIERHAR